MLRSVRKHADRVIIVDIVIRDQGIDLSEVDQES